MPDENADDEVSVEYQYACAAARHFHDAVYLHDDQRLPTADHLFGFAAECAVKSLLLRFTTEVSMTNGKGQPSDKPWWYNPDKNKMEWLGHIDHVLQTVSLLTHGRNSPELLQAMDRLSDFASWNVADRYTDGTTVEASVVACRREAATLVLTLHEQAVITGRLS
ncbi:hypothetical protein [Streptomyces sp. NBC_01615]|uniref:hypothetical protein n=1 Tax=Streptomyces sp. NBC_01615 TaxID=2975898 RepID=UPI003865F662